MNALLPTIEIYLLIGLGFALWASRTGWRSFSRLDQFRNAGRVAFFWLALIVMATCEWWEENK